LYEDQYTRTFMITSRSVLPRIRSVSDKLLYKIKSHIQSSTKFFFFSKIVPFIG